MQFPDAAEVGEMCLLGLNNNKPEDEGLTSNILDCFYPMSTARVSTMSSGSATISKFESEQQPGTISWVLMMMISIITFNSNLVPLIEGL